MAVSVGYAAALRRELAARNRAWAERHGIAFCESYGSEPMVAYPGGETAHGNFFPASFGAILRRPDWRRRLEKVHTTARRALPRQEGRWRELDSASSSDALLMNIFCHPRALADPLLRAWFGAEPGDLPAFGVRAKVPLLSGRFDATELDMALGGSLVEAKLTESGFASAPEPRLAAYRDFDLCFDRSRLTAGPRATLANYQLLRGILAAQAQSRSFVLCCDRRRPDLMEAWSLTLGAVRESELRARCKLCTWQDLVPCLARPLRGFLADKYGIE